MRSRMTLVATCALFAALAPVAEAQVAGEDEGVTAKRGRHGIVLRFSDEAARVYRRIAGRRVAIECVRLGRGVGGLSVVSGSRASVRAPRRRGPLQSGHGGPADVCSVRRTGPAHTPVAWAALTERGRVYIDESVTVARMMLPFLTTEADAPSIDDAVRGGRGFVVALAGPDATPPAGQVGYWTDGSRVVVVAVSARGRRLYTDAEGDDFRTNVLAYLVDDGF